MCAAATLPAPQAEPFGPVEFAAAAGVSRETRARFEHYATLLAEWQSRFNLVSRATLGDLWRRHMLDSAQLLPLVPPTARSLADLGSGAGFPGLVLAELLRSREGFRTVLFEATAKKCRFLKVVAEELGLSVEIRPGRIEEAPPEPFDVITARACAPLGRLLHYAQRFAGAGGVCLFLKGQSVGAELTETARCWRMHAIQHPSRSDPSGTILEIREFSRIDRNTARKT